MDHSLPLICLLIDYIFVNSIPFVRRHAIILVNVVSFYLFINLSITKIRNKPVYEPISWDSFQSCITPFLLAIYGIIIFFILEYLTIIKIKFYGNYN
jgi:hypothetical protein